MTSFPCSVWWYLNVCEMNLLKNAVKISTWDLLFRPICSSLKVYSTMKVPSPRLCIYRWAGFQASGRAWPRWYYGKGALGAFLRCLYDLHQLIRCLDWTFTHLANELLWSVQASRTLESPSAVRGERTTLWSSRKLYWYCNLGASLILTNFFFGRVKTPSNFYIKPEPKTQKRILSTLNAHFAYLAPRSNNARTKGKAGAGGEEFLGEYQTLMEQEFLDFVVFDVPWIVS